VKDDRVYLKHILRCVARIEEYTRGGREMFLSTSIVQDATLRNLQTLAESTQRLSADLKSLYPNVDWRPCPVFGTFWFTIIWASTWITFINRSRIRFLLSNPPFKPFLKISRTNHKSRPPNPRVHPISPKSGLPGDAPVVRCLEHKAEDYFFGRCLRRRDQ
jgi:Protein of unknown function DUF86